MLTLRPYQKEAVASLILKIDNEYKDNILVNASVGAGKSLIIAETLRHIELKGERALCLTMNSTLISQNYQAYIRQGGSASIYCAALNVKSAKGAVVFGAPISVKKAIEAEDEIAAIHFSILVIDEAHNCNDDDGKTSYMQIITHYKEVNPKLIVIGLTGTPFRGKGLSIVGEHKLFKESVANITTEWLVKNKYLVPPVWGFFDSGLYYDFSQAKTNKLGTFTQQSLAKIVDQDTHRTNRIMRQVQQITKDRNGVFIFTSSIKHCYDCQKLLGTQRAAVITGKTSERDRARILDAARIGSIKYLINVNVLTTGVDIPNFDTIVMVRPTESLVLYTQCIGRGLRLYPDKKECLVLDYAKNLERHGDLENPFIRDAYIAFRNESHEYNLECPECNNFNLTSASSCAVCSYLFRFKSCPYCSGKNDVRARKCRHCKCELIDPDLKLTEFPSCKDKVKSFVTRSMYHCNSTHFEIMYSFDNDYLNQKYGYYTEKHSIKSQSGIDKFKKAIFNDICKEKDIEINEKTLKSLIRRNKLKQIVNIEGVETYDGLKVFVRNIESDNPIKLANEKALVVEFRSYPETTALQVVYKAILNNKLISRGVSYSVLDKIDHARFKKEFGSKELSLVQAIGANTELEKPKYIVFDGKNVKDIIHYDEGESTYVTQRPATQEQYYDTFRFKIINIKMDNDMHKSFSLRCYGYDAKENKHLFFPMKDYFSYTLLKLYKENRLSEITIEQEGRWDIRIKQYILDDGTILENDYTLKDYKDNLC